VSGYENTDPLWIHIPWEARKGMRWYHTSVYAQQRPPANIPQWGPPTFAVPIPLTVVDLPHTTYRIWSRRGQIDARSKYAPYVRVEGITYDELAGRLSACSAANVPLDRVFDGQDIRVLVRPYDYVGPDKRGTGLSLLGVTLIASPDDNWTPVR
jgi:hypothetical protein